MQSAAPRGHQEIIDTMIEDAVWQGWAHSMTRVFWAPGVQAWWPNWRNDCQAAFRDFLESSTPPTEQTPPK